MADRAEGGEPVYIARAHHGSLAREERLIVEDLLKSGRAALPGGHLVARARHRHGRGGPRDPGRVAEVGHRRAPAHRPRGPRRRRRLARAHLPEVPRRPARVRGRRQAHARRRHRADRRAAQPARRARPADRRHGRQRRRAGRSPSCTRSCAAPIRSPSSRASCSTACSTCSTAATPPRSSPSCARASSGTGWRTRSARASGARQLAVTNAGTIPDRGLYGVHLPDGRRVGELDEEMVYEARPGQTFLLGASTWRIEEITRDRVIVTPAPGAPGAVPFWRGDGSGRPKELGQAIGAFAREAVDREPERAGRRVRPRRARRAQPVRLPARAARGHARGAERPHDRGRALPRRDRRLAAVRAVALRRPRARGLGAGAVRAHPRRVRPRVRRDLVGRRHHRPPARRRRAARRRAACMVEPDEIEELVVRELSSSALFGARFRENAARALLLPRAYPGKRTPLWQQRLKAQSLLEVAKRYGQFPIILETYRECLQDVLDLPGARGAAARAAHARAVAGRGRDPARLAVRLLAAVRLRRHLHVRGRHAERRAARGGALARPRPAARAARPGGAARADRPGRAGGGRGRPAARERAHARRERRRRCTTCCAPSAT